MELDGLAAVNQLGHVDRAGGLQDGGTGTGDDGEGGEDHLGHITGVFGGESQIVAACTQPDGVEQRVLGRPGILLRADFKADGVGIDSH